MLKPVCYAILGKSGMWMSESCICEDADVLQAELEYAREEKPSEDYKIVPLYTRPSGKVDELIEALEAYINILNREIESLVGITYVHGWQSQLVEEGKVARERITSARVALVEEE